MPRRRMNPGHSEFAVGPRELVAEPLVLLAQAADLRVDGLEPAPQRRFRGALAGRDRRCGRGTGAGRASPRDRSIDVR